MCILLIVISHTYALVSYVLEAIAFIAIDAIKISVSM